MKHYNVVLQLILSFWTTALPAVVCGSTTLNLANGPQANNRTSAVGMNMGRPESWSPTYLFVDATLKSRNWIPHACGEPYFWDNGTTVIANAEGWVIGVANNTCPGLLFLDEETEAVAHYVPLGTYVLIWEGEGALMV
jgi:hypothetical protein